MESKSIHIYKYLYMYLFISYSYISVYFAEKNGEKFAIKALDKDKIIEENLVENIKKEIQLMRMISHPYIVKLYEVIATQQKIMLVMEFIEGGDLFDTISKS